MGTVAEGNCERLRRSLENRQAIFLEHQVLHVRVCEIRTDPVNRVIEARLDPLPTSGMMGAGKFRHGKPGTIGAGYLTSFSDDVWMAGYGGWILYFSPRIVRALIELATSWSAELTAQERYAAANRWLSSQASAETFSAAAVFPRE